MHWTTVFQHTCCRTSDSGWMQWRTTHIKVFGLHEVCMGDKMHHFLPSWQIILFDIMMCTDPHQQTSCNPHSQLTAKWRALQHAHNLQAESNITQIIYTVHIHWVRVQAGSAIIVHQPSGNTIESNASVGNEASALKVKLLAIIVILKMIENSFIISDSLSLWLY